MEIQKAENYRAAVIALLSAEKLPVDDLPQSLKNFRVMIHEDNVIGTAGFEVHGNYGLLRSLVVSKDFHNRGVAGKLLHRIEVLIGLDAIHDIYLLTESAENYFIKKGYKKTDRNTMPAEIQQSSQFSYVCPQSALAMKKSLKDL